MLARKIKSEKMRGMKMRIITGFGDRTRSGTFFTIVSVSRTDNFMNVSNSVTFLRVLSYVPLCFSLSLSNTSGLTLT